MIPLNTLIRDAVWLRCTKEYANQQLTFHIRIKSFAKLGFEGLDRPDQPWPIETGAARWLLGLEMVNLGKQEARAGDLTYHMHLVDNEGFSFRQDDDYGLWLNSKISRKLGLYKLRFEDVVPKIKVDGHVLFKLPDEETDYQLRVTGAWEAIEL